MAKLTSKKTIDTSVKTEPKVPEVVDNYTYDEVPTVLETELETEIEKTVAIEKAHLAKEIVTKVEQIIDIPVVASNKPPLTKNQVRNMSHEAIAAYYKS